MDSLRLQSSSEVPLRGPTPRDIVTPLFRHRRLVAFSFFGILGTAVLWALVAPKQYEAQMKLLVKRERVDNALVPASNDVTEEEINSEVELLQSRDLLEKVVLRCGLDRAARRFAGLDVFFLAKASGADSDVDNDQRISVAVRALQKRLKVSSLKKTNLISVTYEAPDPHLAAKVLEIVANEYLTKHVAVYRAAGASTFFENERQHYQKELNAAEASLSEFDEKENIVAPNLEKEIAIQRLADFDASLRTSQISIDETERRVKKLEAQLSAIPDRATTQIRTSDNGLLLQQLKGVLLNLELKRTDLLQNFKPDYRPVQEVEKEIAKTVAAIRLEESSPLREETTDRDPTHEWLREELAKARTDLDAFRARSIATARVVRVYEDRARSIDKRGAMQQNLLRDEKTAEDNYLLYTHKAEEARISDALGQERIVNVAIAEAPTVPALPASTYSQMFWAMFLGVLLASFTSVGLAFALEFFDPSLRTPDEVRLVLDIPVLAALPEGNTE
jgi:uncharacterized protein involved in exopolysaccharide biosynthesis